MSLPRMLNERFDFSKYYTFENEVIKLSPFELFHIEKLESVSEDEEVWKYFLENGKGGKRLNEYCKKAINNRILEKEYPFVIYDKRINEFAGMTHLYDYNNELGVIKMGHTWFGKKFWGTKLNKQCKYLLFEFIFEDLSLERIGFGVHSQNVRSINALKTIGCKQEGVLRNFLPSLSDDGRVGLLLFSLLKREWNTTVKTQIKNKLF